MKTVFFLTFTLVFSVFALITMVTTEKENSYYSIRTTPFAENFFIPDAACDSVTIFVQQLRTFPPSCCFSVIIDNKLKNAITQIKLDIITATFTNIVVEVNQGWIVSQTPQKDILLSHNSGFIPVGGASPLSFCLLGGNNPDSLKISYNYSAFGLVGTCNVNTTVCSDPAPCDAAFSFQPVGSCGNFQFNNQSTGTPPLTYSWNFGDPGSGNNNNSSAQNPTHQFSKCGDFIVCLKTTALGCIDSVCKTVSYFDIIKPIITCPANLNFQCTNNPNPPATGIATATDNCTPANAIVITHSDVVTGVPCSLNIIRTWQAKDACGNIATCVQTIIIRDNIPPSIFCPANAIVNTNAGGCFYTGSIPQPTATDNCDPVLDFTCSLLTSGSSILITPQTQFPKGVNTITCFARDDCGNQSVNCNFTLTVVDNAPPIIMCPGNMTVSGTFDSAGNCKAVVQNIAPIVTDNCPMLTVSYTMSGATNGQGVTNASGTLFLSGLTFVTYIATDMSGNKDTCSFSILVSCPDNWSCPCPNAVTGGPNLVLNGNFSLGNTGFTNDFKYINPGGISISGDYSVVTNIQVPMANSQWACKDHTTGIGSFLIIDGASSTGNNSAWKQTITGTGGGTFNFCFYANNLVIPSKNFHVPDLGIYFNGVQATPSVMLPESPDAWVPFYATYTGILPVNLEIRTLSFQVVGNDFALDDIQFSKCSDSFPCDAAFTFQSIGTCGNFQFTNQSTGPPPLTYSWNFGDPNSGLSNTSTAQDPTHQFSQCGDFIVCLITTGMGCTDSICKTISFFDQVNPVITCPVNLILRCNTNTSPPATGVATATDDCTPANAIAITFSDAVSGVMPCNGLIVRTWQAKDACGNIATCIQTITINDNIPPNIMCPANLNFQCATNTNPPATGVATATDNCTQTNALVITHSDVMTGTAPCNANIVRTWQAKDDCGNIATCVQTITINDNIPPTIVCPANVTVNTNSGACFYTGILPQATATDNCDQSLDFTYSLLTSGSSILINAQTQFPKGINSITCFARDDCGNQSLNCNFTLTVLDNQAPTINCPNDTAVIGTVNAQGQCKAVVNNLAPIVTDNCPMFSTVYTITGTTIGSGNTDASGTNFMQGLSTVTYTATDMGGNTQTCSLNIIVDCPRPKCDSVSASLTPRVFPASPFACLFDLNISNQASNINQIRITLKTATFGGISINSPFIGNFPLPNLLNLSAVGSIPLGNFIAAGITVMGGTNPDTAFVQFFYNNGQSSCDTNIVFNCPVPPSKCDSVSAFLVPISLSNYDCKYQLHFNNQASTISKIQVDLNTAQFVNVTLQQPPPYGLAVSPANRIIISHPGSIPIGTFHADVGIVGGSNPDTALVRFFYNNGQSSCDTNIIFNCPVDTTCGYSPSCAINMISLNTGLGTNGLLLNPGTYDPYWTITNSPYTGLLMPRPAAVIKKDISWDFQPNTITPCSQWISIFQGADEINNPSGRPYSYSRCFCICKDNSKIKIQLAAMVDDIANFALYDGSGNLVTPLLTISPQILSQAFQLPPDTSETNLILNKGTYCLRVDVRNSISVTGLNICGSISGEGLIRSECCEPNSYISGHKYLDVLCTGQPYSNQTTLPGWQIILCNAAGIAIDTVITDTTGYYGFGPINPGNYSVKEINKPGWTITNPVGNLVQIQLDSHDVQQVNFGNCQSKPKCDSVSAFLIPFQAIPNVCTFQFHIKNQASFISNIQVNLKSAAFSFINPIGSFSPTFTTPNQINITHNLGTIPIGNFQAADFGIVGGSNPDTAIVKFFYNNGLSSCDTNIIFNCPPPPPVFKCDSASATLNSYFSTLTPCNFQLIIDNQASNMTKIEVDLKTISPLQTFAVLVPYTISHLQLGATKFTLHNNILPIPKGKVPAIQFAVNGGSNPDTAFIKFFYNNGPISCDTFIIFNCPLPPPKPKCDSVSAFLVPFQAIPYACTFQFHVNNQATAISKIQIDLKTATFNSAGIISPFSPVISPASRLTITHPSGSIPLGNFHTADLGINIGSNPDTAIVKFFYNNGLSTCDTNIIFNCPVDTTCGYSPTCATTSISLNTGVGANGQLLAPGSFDPNWTVIQTPYTGLILPRPAEVVTPYVSWDMQPNSTTPCAQWISAFQGADKGSGPRYTYSKCFCVCKDSSNIQIKLSAMADNEADFWLYDASGNQIATLLGIHPPGSTPSHAFLLPPDTSTTQLVLKKGTYCIRAGVKNWTRVTGINVCGSITGPGLIKADCCESNSYITGIKYQDTLCNGLPYSGQPKLSGWQIILCDATGNAVDTVTTDASGYYSFGPLKPGNYSVKEINKPGWTLSNPVNNLVSISLDTHDVQQANFGNCPPPVCDSISFWVESLHTIPPACCFRLHIDNKVKNKFTQIPFNLFSASFNSITVDNLNGWFTSQSNLSNIDLTHSSGFIPVGSFTPISWCINNGSNPDTIKVKAEYLVGQSKVSCDTSFVFFCPPPPDTLCGIACQTDSISLNTGVDHSTGQFYNNGNPDPYWSIVQAPYSNLTFPIPAAVTYTNVMFWHDQPNGFQPCSKWVTLGSFTYGHDPGIHVFQRCFCICSDGAMIQIKLSVLADNAANLILCDSTGTTVSQLLNVPSTPGGAFHLPPRDTIVNLILDKGRYCIKANVNNHGSATGLNVCGSIQGTGLGKDICCEPSAITGIKYIDTICTGSPYTGSLQTLQGWQIVLCNQQGVAIDTVTTDQNGSYIFSPLLPGLYTVKELNQTGWTPSVPSTGISSIYLDANQVAQVNFANCPPEIDSCCISKSTFIQNVINAIQLSVIDSMCKAKININRLPPCDSVYLIDWGDGQIDYGPFGSGMWMHTYTQSGLYTIQVPFVEYDHTGAPCFDTLIKYTIEMYCKCECGAYALNMVQNGIVAPVRCNDTLTLSCPPIQALSLIGNFSCLGVDSCQTGSIQWTFTGPSVNLSGNAFPGNIQLNIPGPLNPGYYTLNLSTVCGQQKCTCKITLYQRPCMLADSCTTYCNGISWTNLGTPRIEDMIVYQGKLIVAGLFANIGNPSIAANNIAAWNGFNWSALGAGTNNVIYDLELHNGILYAGGEFTIAGNVPVDKIASWDATTSTWSNISSGGINGLSTNVDALLSTSSGLVVGGKFSIVGTTNLSANNIALLSNSGWSAFSTGFNGPVFSLTTYNNKIVAGGRFGNSPGGLNNIGVWNGSFWDKLGIGGGVSITSIPANSGDGVRALTVLGNDLIAGGQFLNAIPSIPGTKHIAKWNGNSWSSLGAGVNTGNGIYSLLTLNNELLAGGQFSVINNQNIGLLAKWNGNTWSGLAHPVNGIIRAIAVYSPNKDSLCNLYTGGEVLLNHLKCSGVSTKDQTRSIAITIYPNPATDKIYIQFNEIIREEIDIAVYSLLGQRMLHQLIPKNNATNSMMVQTNELNSGTYIIKVSTVKGSTVKKIMIQRGR